MDEHQLRCFVTVVETGNLSKAAKQLHITQPPLSILIRKLEESLGVELFNRQKNRLILNESGKLFYTRARHILASFKTLRQDIRNNAAGTEGVVSVGCSTAASLFILPSVMARIQQAGLKISLVTREGESAYIVNAIRKNELDIGIVRTRYQAEDINTQTLYTEPLMMVIPSDHRHAHKDRLKLADFKDDNFLLHSSTYSNGIRENILDSCSANGFTPNVIYSGNETLPILIMVERGLGIGFAPRMFSHLFTGKRVRFVELEAPKLTTTLSLVTLKSQAESAVAGRFLEITREVLATIGQAHAP